MHRKDYKLIAEAIDTAWVIRWTTIQYSELDAATKATRCAELAATMFTVVTTLADVLGQDNERFDRLRFVQACEGERMTDDETPVTPWHGSEGW